ncbi:MAG: endonuclease/exonuclease/phosphatase family protein [Gemmatimonadota bacterium]|nr:endonuclease/exonuclease/phosphatase family protein [Gemmatimonadota bacterium]
MRAILEWVLIGLGIVSVAGTLLSTSRSPHWAVRAWDFPRVQIACVAAASGGLYALLFFQGSWRDGAFLAAVLLCVVWQVRRIYPYTPLAPVQVGRSEGVGGGGAGRSTVRILISNVQMENRQHARLLSLIGETEPDIVLTLETDATWARALEPLAARFPHVVRQPQENYFGLMLFSRLPLSEPRVDFLVQSDVPSVHTGIELPSGEQIFLHGLHPRPPEPIRDQDSTPRDAELVLVGRTIGEVEDRPTILAGDLNDVAWSPTTELFLRLSALLDPRLGRGFYNSYNANNPLFRYPLDHVFHSSHFRLVELRRLPSVGSDHFPMLVELSYEPEARRRQHGAARRPADEKEAGQRLQKQAEAARTGDDRPGRD